MQKAYPRRIDWENYPSTNTALNADNLNNMSGALDVIDDRVVEYDTTKANQTDMNNTISNVEFNEKTGIFTFLKTNGSSFTIDTLLEKVVTNWNYNEETQKMEITLEDGSVKEVDLSSMITNYDFTDGESIHFVINGGKVTATILNGSITENKLQPNFLADCREARDSSSASKLVAEGFAVGQQDGVDVGPDSPYYHNNAKYFSDKAGGTSLVGLNDTEIINPNNRDRLVYDSNQEKWINENESIDYDAEHSVLRLKSGNTVISSTILDVGASSVIHVDTHETTWFGNPNVTIQIYDSEEHIDGGHFDENGDYYHKIHYLGDYTVIVTDEDGIEYVKHFNNDAIGQVIYIFVDKFVDHLKEWLESASIPTESYSSLADVFANERITRELMTKHASADYLYSWVNYSTDDFDDFANNRNAMKWIGLRDYICDKLMANPILLGKMQNSEYWNLIKNWGSYSEEEFGSDGITMIYDNGIEFVNINEKLMGSGTRYVTKSADNILIGKNGSANGACIYTDSIDLTPYSKIRATANDSVPFTPQNCGVFVAYNAIPSALDDYAHHSHAYKFIPQTDLPNNLMVDISNVSANGYVGYTMESSGSSVGSIVLNKIWLERS